MGVSYRLSRNTRVWLPFWLAVPFWLLWLVVVAVVVVVWLVVWLALAPFRLLASR